MKDPIITLTRRNKDQPVWRHHFVIDVCDFTSWGTKDCEIAVLPQRWNMVRKVVVLFVVLFAVTIDLSESQSFFCNRSEVSNYYVKECANAVRLNPERFSFRCGRFNRRSHALRPNTQLAAAARKHAADMAAKNYFSHRSRDGRSFSDRIRNEGYNGWMIGENLAMGYNSALGAIGGWMCSEGHRRNLLVILVFPPDSWVRTRPANSMKWGRESSVVEVFVTPSK